MDTLRTYNELSPEIKKLYLEAWNVQDASNLCGVAQSFARICKDLMRIERSTAHVNTHEIITLWLDKMISLNGYTYDRADAAFTKAHEISKIAEGA